MFNTFIFYKIFLYFIQKVKFSLENKSHTLLAKRNTLFPLIFIYKIERTFFFCDILKINYIFFCISSLLIFVYFKTKTVPLKSANNTSLAVACFTPTKCETFLKKANSLQTSLLSLWACVCVALSVSKSFYSTLRLKLVLIAQLMIHNFYCYACCSLSFFLWLLSLSANVLRFSLNLKPWWICVIKVGEKPIKYCNLLLI